MRGYVYTMSAAAARLRRGHKSVLVFVPYVGRCMRVTRANLAAARKRFNKAARQHVTGVGW
jgi:hypothetical protein